MIGLKHNASIEETINILKERNPYFDDNLVDIIYANKKRIL
jgi:hypothetical protein